MNQLLQSFSKNQNASVAVIFSVALLPIMILVGVAIEYTRISTAESVMESTLDNAASTIGSLFKLGPQAERKIEAMINANSGRETADVKISIKQNKLHIEARDEINTPLLSTIGQPKREITASLELETNISGGGVNDTDSATGNQSFGSSSQERKRLKAVERQLQKSLAKLAKSQSRLSYRTRMQIERSLKHQLRMVRNRIKNL